MAYLSNTDDEEQQKQGSGGGFSAFGGDSSGQSQQQGQSGGDYQGQGNAFSAWIGGSQDKTQSQPAADQAAAQNAKGYQQTYAGDDNKDAKSEAQQGGSSAGFSNAPMQAGLSGGGQGTGFINFQNYENNAPSQANAISSAGKSVIGAEGTNLDNAEAPVKGAVAQAGQVQSPGSDQASVDATVSGILDGTPPAGTAGGIAPHGIDMNPGVLSPGTGGVSPTDGGVQKITDWINPKTIDPTINYTPGSDYSKFAPELTETPILGGQTKPSVNDYLARDEIAGGAYTQGDRMLDGNLIAGDAGAQQAIKDNQTADTALQARVKNEIPAIQTQANTANAASGQTAAMTQQAITDTSNKLQNDIQAATDAYNKNPTPQTLANEQTAVKAYADWYNSGAANQGGTWTQTGSGQGQVAAYVTPQQAQEADRIYQLQHPGDTNPAHFPYPDPLHPSQVAPASTWGGSGTPGAVAVTSVGQMDPGDTGNPQNGSTTPETIVDKYSTMLPDYGNTGGKSYQWTNLTPAESAVYVTMHPDKAGNYPAVTPSDLSAAAYQLQSIISSAGTPAGINPAALPPIKAELAAIQAKIQALGATSGGNKSPYDYGKSLGMTDAELASLGIHAPGAMPVQTGNTSLPGGTNLPQW